jgi:hypothetical protein
LLPFESRLHDWRHYERKRDHVLSICKPSSSKVKREKGTSEIKNLDSASVILVGY